MHIDSLRSMAAVCKSTAAKCSITTYMPDCLKKTFYGWTLTHCRLWYGRAFVTDTYKGIGYGAVAIGRR
jgi:hypothetical protein